MRVLDQQSINKSYYAIIPANVRYDEDLTPNAKLLYGEITALCNEKGYCWASNDYFAELYKTSTRTISRWIKQLISKGYIISNLIYRKGTKEVEQRHLYISFIGGDKNVSTYGQKCHEGIDKNVMTPMDKNVQDNTTVFNNTINNTLYTTQSSAVVDTNTELIENKTHLKLTKNMKKIVSSWDKERLSKAIELFNSKGGKYFSLLEKIYNDDGNYSNNIITNKLYKQTGFHNFDQTFLNYEEEEFERIIEKSQKVKYGV